MPPLSECEEPVVQNLKGLRKMKEAVNIIVEETKESSIKRPWHALVSYVDELTVGGRRNSKGQFIDRFANFPGFGRNKTAKTPQDCFPKHCYQKYFLFIISYYLEFEFANFI